MSLTNPAPHILNSEIKLNRYWNFRGIVETSKNNKVADMLGKTAPYVSAIAGPKPNRAIGDEIAGQIERAFHLPPGSLDAKPDRRTTNEDPLIGEVARIMSVSTDMDRQLILSVVKAICGHSASIIAHLNSSPAGSRTVSGSEIKKRLEE